MIKKKVALEQGFTLVEVLVVVVIVAILAAISVPIYLDYVEAARASEAKGTIGAIYNSCKMFYQDRGFWPQDIQELEDGGYLTIDLGTKRKWTFSIVGESEIVATSTEEMRGGAGKKVRFDIQQGRYFGYGFPKEGQE